MRIQILIFRYKWIIYTRWILVHWCASR